MNSLFAPPSASFDEPLEMLRACHQRILRHARLALSVAEHVQDEGVDDEARTAAASVMRYFDVAARDHHLDEEVDLFPAMLAAATANPALSTLVARLTSEHEAIGGYWSMLRAQLEAVRDGRADATVDSTIAQAVVRQYEDHIREEETILLPLAAKLLDRREMERIGRAMAKRRGQS